MSLCLLLTACAVSANPAPIPQNSWYPVAGYATATDAPPAYPGGNVSYAPPAYPGGYVTYPPVMPMQPYWGVMPVGGCAGGNCGSAGCGAPACAAPACAPACNDCAPRKKLFGCFHKRNDCCEEPCGQPDYKACAQTCKAMSDSCCCKEPRCGLLARLRNCFKHKRDCCPQQECNTCCKPSLRDRLKKCFNKNDCCEQTCCKPSLHDRLRAAFRKCKKQDDCCCTASASPAAGKPEAINPPKEMPKEMPKDAKDAVRGPLPKGPPVQVISEVPF